MKSKQFGFWTPERLLELERIFPQLAPAALMRYYGKPFHLIQTAYAYQTQSKPMIESTELVDGIKVTRYRAAYAEGAEIRATVKNRMPPP